MERARRNTFPLADWFKAGVVTILVLVILGIALNSWVSVGVGHGMMVVDAWDNTVSEPVLGAKAGFFINPLKRFIGVQYPIDIYYQMDSVAMWSEYKEETQNGVTVYTEKAKGDFSAIPTLSKEGLSIEVDILVRWSLNPDALRQLYLKYPTLQYKTTMFSVIREKVRDTIATYTAIETIEKRDVIAQKLEEAIRAGLSTEPTLQGVINMPDLVIDLRNIDPSIEFMKGVEAKLVAEQAKIRAQFEYERILTLARAEGEAKIIVANSTRESINQILSVTGEKNSTKIAELYLTLEAMKVIAPNTKTFIVVFGAGQVPMVYPIPEDTQK